MLVSEKDQSSRNSKIQGVSKSADAESEGVKHNEVMVKMWSTNFGRGLYPEYKQEKNTLEGKEIRHRDLLHIADPNM